MAVDSHRPELTEAARECRALREAVKAALKCWRDSSCNMTDSMNNLAILVDVDDNGRALSPSGERSVDWLRENYPSAPSRLTRGKGWHS